MYDDVALRTAFRSSVYWTCVRRMRTKGFGEPHPKTVLVNSLGVNPDQIQTPLDRGPPQDERDDFEGVPC